MWLEGTIVYNKYNNIYTLWLLYSYYAYIWKLKHQLSKSFDCEPWIQTCECKNKPCIMGMLDTKNHWFCILLCAQHQRRKSTLSFDLHNSKKKLGFYGPLGSHFFLFHLLNLKSEHLISPANQIILSPTKLSLFGKKWIVSFALNHLPLASEKSSHVIPVSGSTKYINSPIISPVGPPGTTSFHSPSTEKRCTC